MPAVELVVPVGESSGAEREAGGGALAGLEADTGEGAQLLSPVNSLRLSGHLRRERFEAPLTPDCPGTDPHLKGASASLARSNKFDP